MTATVSLGAEAAQKKKKGHGGRRKSLIRLDSAKEMEGFNLDFLPVFLGFPSPAWISFRRILISFRRVWKSFIASARPPALRSTGRRYIV
jgi:hypothetical protein